MPDGMRHAWDSDVEFIVPISGASFWDVCRCLYTWYAVAASEFFGCCRGTARVPQVRMKHLQKLCVFPHFAPPLPLRPPGYSPFQPGHVPRPRAPLMIRSWFDVRRAAWQLSARHCVSWRLSKPCVRTAPHTKLLVIIDWAVVDWATNYQHSVFDDVTSHQMALRWIVFILVCFGIICSFLC